MWDVGRQAAVRHAQDQRWCATSWADEYAFLRANARARTKLTIPAPSWHRIFWHPKHSRAAYPTAEDFLRAIATTCATR